MAQTSKPESESDLVQIHLLLKRSGLRRIDDEARRRGITRTAQIRDMLAYSVQNMPTKEGRLM